jgi:hypothetical protein
VVVQTLDDSGDAFKRRAREKQGSLDALIQDEQDTEALMERCDRLIADLIDLANAWDAVDQDTASRVREQEMRIHDLRGRVAHLAEMEANEAMKMMASIRDELARAKD